MKTFSSLIKILPVTMSTELEATLKEMDELTPGDLKCKVNYDCKRVHIGEDHPDDHYVATYIESTRRAKINSSISMEFQVCAAELIPSWMRSYEGDSARDLTLKNTDYPELKAVLAQSCFLREVLYYCEPNKSTFAIRGSVLNDGTVIGIHRTSTGNWKTQAIIRVYLRISATRNIFTDQEKQQFSIADILRHKEFFSRVLNQYRLDYDKIGEDHMRIPYSSLPANIKQEKAKASRSAH